MVSSLKMYLFSWKVTFSTRKADFSTDEISFQYPYFLLGFGLQRSNVTKRFAYQRWKRPPYLYLHIKALFSIRYGVNEKNFCFRNFVFFCKNVISFYAEAAGKNVIKSRAAIPSRRWRRPGWWWRIVAEVAQCRQFTQLPFPQADIPRPPLLLFSAFQEKSQEDCSERPQLPSILAV